MKLTILMPCLNEAETLAACIKKASSWVSRSGLEAEILIADNGSTDGSQDIAKRAGARVVDVPARGYGAALSYGAHEAFGEYIIMGDSDDSYDFSKLDAFVTELDKGADLVMGNRFLGGIAPGAMPWKNKYIGNPLLSFIGRLLFRCPASDFHCGLRAFRKDSFERMDLRTSGMEFASEMLIKANLFRMNIVEVPTTLDKDGRSRPPHLRPWRDGWRHLRFMLLFSPRYLFFVPGLLLFLVSFLFYCFLIKGSLSIGSITFDIHTLLYAQTGIILGMLSMIFGVVIRMFGARERLMGEHALLEKMRKSPVLEIGSIAGLLAVSIGVIYAIKLLVGWGAMGFGPLEYRYMLRAVSFSTLLIIGGGIVALTAMIMGFLTLPTKNR